MKKVLLSMIAAAAVVSANAQTRLVLYEEFSGENCNPCAAYNPGLMTLLNANTSKAILIKYQSPIPTAGPIYGQNTTDVNARLSYYSVNSAPTGLLDGGNSDNIANHTQGDIDAAYNVPTPFTIVATHSWSPDGATITINVDVTSATPFTGGNMVLRAALVEHLVYDAPPGTNGETEFHNVMRKMYPSATGTPSVNTWTAGQTETYTLTGAVPSYVDKTDEGTFVIVWLEDDATKIVAQSAKTVSALLPLDVKSEGVDVASTLVCTATNASVVPTVTLKNKGTAPLTSTDIYVKVDNGAWTLDQSWTGSLASDATIQVPLTALSLAPGTHYIQDSLSMPNSAADVNLANNWSYTLVNVHSTVTNAIPFTEGFESAGAVPANWIMYDANSNGYNMIVTRVNNQNYGHGASTYFFYHNNYGYPAGEVNYAIMPSADLTAGGDKALDFWVAHATYQTEQDKLEVVYSTNCGQSWTSVWSQQGPQLQTTAATTSNFVPTTAAMWHQKSADISSVPAGAMIAFRATSAFGNNLFVDDVEIRMGTALGVETFTTNSANVSLFPNPATDNATLTFNLDRSSDVQVQVLDAVGRLVSVAANGNMNKGRQEVAINTANLSSGIYNVVVKTSTGTVTQRLTVAK